VPLFSVPLYRLIIRITVHLPPLACQDGDRSRHVIFNIQPVLLVYSSFADGSYSYNQLAGSPGIDLFN
jgi:hypothetical protein